MEQVFPGVYRSSDDLYTANAVPGVQVYGEPLKTVEGVEYRRWSYERSKAAGAIKKGIRDVPIQRDDAVLYLGASTGTTVSHVSDIVSQGMVYAVEYSPKVARQLLDLATQRNNVAPILGDARTPADYMPLCSTVDVIYQDVAQRDQAAILQRNADAYLREGGHAMIAIKARSVSTSEEPEAVFDRVKETLRETFEIVDGVKLAPFHADHLFLLLQYED